MAGHHTWSKVKRLKGTLDQKRGSLFRNLAKEISVATRLGGGDPAGDARLRSAIRAARAQSMPSANIERVIQRGAGVLGDRATLEAFLYEDDAPGSVAVIVEVSTDSAQEFRPV